MRDLPAAQQQQQHGGRLPARSHTHGSQGQGQGPDTRQGYEARPDPATAGQGRQDQRYVYTSSPVHVILASHSSLLIWRAGAVVGGPEVRLYLTSPHLYPTRWAVARKFTPRAGLACRIHGPSEQMIFLVSTEASLTKRFRGAIPPPPSSGCVCSSRGQLNSSVVCGEGQLNLFISHVEM